MAELFTSFDEAWSFFLRRTAPLNEFFADFDEDEGTVIEAQLRHIWHLVSDGVTESLEKNLPLHLQV